MTACRRGYPTQSFPKAGYRQESNGAECNIVNNRRVQWCLHITLLKRGHHIQLEKYFLVDQFCPGKVGLKINSLIIQTSARKSVACLKHQSSQKGSHYRLLEMQLRPLISTSFHSFLCAVLFIVLGCVVRHCSESQFVREFASASQRTSNICYSKGNFKGILIPISCSTVAKVGNSSIIEAKKRREEPIQDNTAMV